jgi:hypothetical protein
VAAGVSRYRAAYNAGATGRALPEGLASLADDDPRIDSAHDAGRNGVAFKDWQLSPGAVGSAPEPAPGDTPGGPPAPSSQGPRKPGARAPGRAKPKPGRAGSGRKGSPRRIANRLATPAPNLAPGVSFSGGPSGLFIGAIVYALVLSVAQYGAAGPGLWFKAKFLNEPAAAKTSSVTVA